MIVRVMPVAPIIRGARTWYELQAYWTPPQQRPIRKEVRLAMKRMPPGQSTIRILEVRDTRSVCSLTKKKDIGTAIPQMGRLR